MINLDSDSLTLLKTILKEHLPTYEIWLFGSRATPHIKPHSDIDLAIITEKSLETGIMAGLILSLSESDLPYKVDLVDWSTIDDTFKNIIRKNYSVIQSKE